MFRGGARPAGRDAVRGRPPPGGRDARAAEADRRTRRESGSACGNDPPGVCAAAGCAVERSAGRNRDGPGAAGAGSGPSGGARRHQRGAGAAAQPRRTIYEIVGWRGRTRQETGFSSPRNAPGSQHDAVEDARSGIGRTGDHLAGAGNQRRNRKAARTGAKRRIEMGETLQPLVFIVSGPSGSGKSTLVQRILELPGTMPSVSCTTRPRRTTESSGKCYHFVSEAEFDAMVARGEFLEYARVFGKHSYGTPLKWLEESRKKGLDLVLEIDVQGAAQVKEKLPESVAIFILPPSREELERRLRDRGQDSDEEIARRLAKSRDEIAQFGKYYDFCVVNEDVERAGREAQAIVTALRCTSARRRARVEQLLASFGRV